MSLRPLPPASLKARLVGFSLLVVLLMVAFVLLLEQQKDDVRAVRRRIADDWNESRLLFRMQGDLTELHEKTAGALTPEVAAAMQPLLAQYESRILAIEDHANDDTAGRAGENQELVAVEAARDNLAAWRAFQSRLLSGDLTGEEGTDTPDRLFAEGSEAVLSFSEGSWRELDHSLSELRASEMSIERLTIHWTLGMALLLATGWVCFAYWLLRPLSRVRAMARRLSRREFEAVLTPGREPREIAELLEAFGTMAREIAAFTRDLEERVAQRTRELDASQRQLQLVVDRLPDAIGLSDSAGRLLRSNPSYRAMFGDGAVSRLPDVLASPASPQGYHRFQVAGGPPRLLDAHAFSIEGGRHLGDAIVLEHIRDVTRPCEVEAALASSQKLAAIGRLSSGIAHEINNPLTAIGACAEGLLRRIEQGEPDQKTLAEYLGIIRHEVFRCKEITEKLLDVARPRAGAPSCFALSDALRGTALLVQPLAQHAGVAILQDTALPDDDFLVADRRAIDQILLNLMLNAIEAVEGGGHITLRAAGDSERVVLSVADDGWGIRPEDLPRVFEPFFSRRRDNNGTGLGLFVCQGLAEALGGQLTASSPGPGAGAVFTLTLPRRRLPTETPVPA